MRRASLVTLASGGGSKGERAARLRHLGKRRRLERGERAGAAPPVLCGEVLGALSARCLP